MQLSHGLLPLVQLLSKLSEALFFFLSDGLSFLVYFLLAFFELFAFGHEVDEAVSKVFDSSFTRVIAIGNLLIATNI